MIDLVVREIACLQARTAEVFERMKAERGPHHHATSSDGKAESRRIIAEADRQKARILPRPTSKQGKTTARES